MNGLAAFIEIWKRIFHIRYYEKPEVTNDDPRKLYTADDVGKLLKVVRRRRWLR